MYTTVEVSNGTAISFKATQTIYDIFIFGFIFYMNLNEKKL